MLYTLSPLTLNPKPYTQNPHILNMAIGGLEGMYRSSSSSAAMTSTQGTGIRALTNSFFIFLFFWGGWGAGGVVEWAPKPYSN